MYFNKSRLIFYFQIWLHPTTQYIFRIFNKLMFECYRDNAVYRSNSFKFERRGPETHLPPANPIDQVIEKKKPVRSVKEVILKLKHGFNAQFLHEDMKLKKSMTNLCMLHNVCQVRACFSCRAQKENCQYVFHATRFPWEIRFLFLMKQFLELGKA